MCASVASVTGWRSESRSCRWVYMAVCYLLNGRPAAHRIVVETPALHAPDGGQQLVIIRRVVDGIDGGRVDDEERSRRELVEEARIGLVQAHQVIALDVLL